VKQISDNEIYLLIKYIKNILWRVAKRLSHIEDARCLKVKEIAKSGTKVLTERTFYSRSSTMKHMEKILSTWIDAQNLCHRPVGKYLVQGKARSICEDLEDL